MLLETLGMEERQDSSVTHFCKCKGETWDFQCYIHLIIVHRRDLVFLVLYYKCIGETHGYGWKKDKDGIHVLGTSFHS